MIFYPKQGEIDLRLLLNDDTKRFFLPRVEGDDLAVCPYALDDELCLSKFKVLEPTCAAATLGELDLIIVPALAADKKKNRLGYGGGFYDRLLAKTAVKSICVVPNACLFENLQTEAFDRKVDEIFSD